MIKIELWCGMKVSLIALIICGWIVKFYSCLLKGITTSSNFSTRVRQQHKSHSAHWDLIKYWTFYSYKCAQKSLILDSFLYRSVPLQSSILQRDKLKKRKKVLPFGITKKVFWTKRDRKKKEQKRLMAAISRWERSEM